MSPRRGSYVCQDTGIEMKEQAPASFRPRRADFDEKYVFQCFFFDLCQTPLHKSTYADIFVQRTLVQPVFQLVQWMKMVTLSPVCSIALLPAANLRVRSCQGRRKEWPPLQCEICMLAVKCDF